jgi:hypothetical protein
MHPSHKENSHNFNGIMQIYQNCVSQNIYHFDTNSRSDQVLYRKIKCITTYQKMYITNGTF